MDDDEYSRPGRSNVHQDANTTIGSRRLRRFFFALAAIWGFGAGAAGIAAGLRLGGVPFSVDAKVWLALLAGGLAAVVGGIIASEAYRESRHRRR